MNPSRLSPNGVSPRFTCIFVGILVGTTLAATRSAPGDQVSTTPAKLQETMTGGLHGYISMKVPPPPDGFGFGISFYSAAWPLLAEPLQSFQIGLPGTWILPDNRGYERPLCPPGTIARDRWAERGPSYRDVFQTIEGGMGFWRSTQFPSATPKFRMNGPATCYNVEIPGEGAGDVGTNPRGIMTAWTVSSSEEPMRPIMSGTAASTSTPSSSLVRWTSVRASSSKSTGR